MDYKQKQLEKERQKALGDILIAECKLPSPNLDTVKAILDSGADINYNNSRALYLAAKGHNFALIKLLIENGALKNNISITYISTMCDLKGYSDILEPQFFEILELLHSKTGDYISLFTPYINNMAVNGRLDKIYALIKRYSLSEKEVAGAVYSRIIFEIIIRGFDATLDFIEKYRNWIDQAAFDLSVASNEWLVMEYILEKSAYRTPSDTAVAQSIYNGSFEVLTILQKIGYNFKNKPLFLEKACRAAYSNGTQSLEFLLKNGYSIYDKYKGKTLLQHAADDNNLPLLQWLNKIMKKYA